MPYCFLKTVELTVLLLIVWSCTVCCFLPRSVCIRQIVRQRLSILHESERPTQIFVGRLPLNISEQRLVDALHSAAVPVLSVALQKDKITGHHKGFGNIWFNNSRSASDALDSLQNFTIDGASLLFEPFQPLMGERTSKLVPDGRSIYVGNLPLDASKEEILEFCRDAGLTNVFGIRQPKGPSRGFVHIDFSNSSEAKAAQLALSEKTLRGRRLIVGDSRLRHDVGVGEVRQERFEIFVGNVSTKITQEYFKGFLDEVLGKEKYRSVSLGRHRVTGNPDFYAFVDCGSEENRQAALRKLKGLKLIDRVVRPELPRPPRPVFHSW